MKRCGVWNGLRVISAALAVVIIFGACATVRAKWPSLPDLSSIATPEQAKKVLADAELIRIAYRDNVVSAYQAKLINDERYIQLRNIDKKFTNTWERLADAVDEWSGLKVSATDALSISTANGQRAFAANYPDLLQLSEIMKQEVR